MPSLTPSLESALERALTAAGERQHEYATLEHLLLALTDDDDADDDNDMDRRFGTKNRRLSNNNIGFGLTLSCSSSDRCCCNSFFSTAWLLFSSCC